MGTTKQATNRTIASITTGIYNDWTLNATGEGNIIKDGITKFGFRIEADRADIEPTWVASEEVKLHIYQADNSGTDKDPKLVVEDDAVADTGNMFQFFQ